jgi:prepilin-type N-terminal cleavage/methylation domain-containing protein
LSPSSRADTATGGFTLIEVVVALAVVAVVAAAIAALSSSNRRSVGASIGRIQTALAARTQTIVLGNRANIGTGFRNGQSGGFAWSYDSRPLETQRDGGDAPMPWAPYWVTVEVAGPGGARVLVNTIQLRRLGQ